MRSRRLGIGLAFAAPLLLIAALAAAAVNGPTKAPRFTVKDVTGRTLDLDELRQRGPVLLDFWATWCKPCLEALPEFQRWHKAYAERGLTVIGISVDGPRNHAKVRPFAKRLGLEYPIAIDQDERIRHLYQVVAMPTTILIDRSGQVVSARIGFRPGEGAEIEKEIQALLGSADSTATEAAPDSAGAQGH